MLIRCTAVWTCVIMSIAILIFEVEPMKILRRILFILAAILLVASAGLNVYQYMTGNVTYLQNPDDIYIMEAGILQRNEAFQAGEDHVFSYDFTNEHWQELLTQYPIASIAGEGGEFARAVRLMDEYAPRLTHESNFDGSVPFEALSLLDYSLDNPRQGVNCRCKAQILNEMCLALGIYARKVWIMPYSKYDNDCHVVNEVWDSALGKWVMLDITNNQYWIDENGTPLSVLEIREKGAKRELCTPVCPGEDTSQPEKLLEKYKGSFLYIMKNMVYTQYCTEYTTGEARPIYSLVPENMPTDYEWLVSLKAVEASPIP